MIIIVIEECQLILHTVTFKRYYVFYSHKLSYVFNKTGVSVHIC